MFNKIILITILSTTFAFAKGGGGSGGGSFGGYYNANKYGQLKISQTQSGISGNIYLKTLLHVRYKNWFSTHHWKSGYATSHVYKNGKRYNAAKLQINQHHVEKPPTGVTKHIKRRGSKNNTSYLRINLVKNLGAVATKHLITINGKTFEKKVFNEWGGISFSTGDQTVLEW